MYTGYKLDNVQRAKLLLQYIPKYKRVIAEHVTLCLGKHIPYEIKSVRAYGFVESEGMQYFLCEVNGRQS